MDCRFFKLMFIVLFLFIYSSEYIDAYNEKTTHKKINEYSAKQSELEQIIKNRLGLLLGLDQEIDEKKIIEWIIEGGKREDDMLILGDFMTLLEGPLNRPLFHFHDPLKFWETAGLWGNDSLVVWALFFDDDPFTMDNEYSWPAARQYYYNALIGIDSEYYYAKMFRSLGQLMHLVSDAAVPAHVRNDAHPGIPTWILDDLFHPEGDLTKDLYEKWAEKNYDKEDEDVINYSGQAISQEIFNRADLDQPLKNPILALFDQNVYSGSNPDETWACNVGLAEFTNANFFSQDTMFGLYPHPDLLDMTDDWKILVDITGEDGEPDRVYFILHPEKGYLLAAISYFDNKEVGVLTQNDQVWEDYASELIPRAVGYSTALLNYFFRGDFSIKQGVGRRNPSFDLTGLDLKVKNSSKLDENTEQIEPFGKGELFVTYRYYPPGYVEPVWGLVEGVYTIDSDADPINSEYVPIRVNFPDPIPFGSKYFSFTLVFRGKLGQETDAVAARVFELTSRIAYYTEPNEADNTANIFTILPDGTDNRQVTDATSVSPGYDAPAWSSDGRLLAFARSSCDNVQPDGSCLWVDYERNITITEQPFYQGAYPGNVANILQYLDADKWEGWEQPEAVHILSFSFSPDGSRMVAATREYADIRGSLLVYDVLEGNWNYLYNYVQGEDPLAASWHLSALANAPEWSPQGDAITFCRAGTKASIWTINPDTGEMIRITNVEGDGYGEYDTSQPAWTVDGDQILFVSDREHDGVQDIWIMDRTGANQEKVYNCTDDCYSPSMSPDGQKIAFEMNSDVYTVNMDGSDCIRVTFSGRAKAPDWSPLMVDATEPYTLTWDHSTW